MAMPPFPLTLNTSDILGLTASLLGLAGIRSYDIKNGNR